MMTWLALRTLLRTSVGRVPGMVWAGVFVAGFLVTAAIALVKHGERKERRKEIAAAHVDTVRRATVVVRQKSEATDSLIRRAKATQPASVTTGHTRTELRERVEIIDSGTVKIDGVLTSAPPLFIALTQASDAKIGADSAHMAVLDSLPAVVLDERLARTQRDTAVSHQQNDPALTEDEGHSGRALVIVGAAIATVVIIVHFLHH